MHIVMAGDARMVCGMELVMYSTMLHNRDVHWHLLTMDCEVDHKDICQIQTYKKVPESDIRWMDFMIRFMDPSSTLTVYDTKEPYLDYLKNSVNDTTPFTPFTALRLIIDIVMPDVPHCLYLDSDVIVQKDLGWMYAEYTSQDCDYAAHVTPEACDGWGEMVAGVAVFNLDHMRRSGFMERARNNYNRFWHKFPDQNALAKAGDPMKMPETYDYIDDHKLAPYPPAILHFTNGNKYKIYTVAPGVFFRYYPEHLYLKEGLDVLREVYANYQNCKKDHLIHEYKIIQCPAHPGRPVDTGEADEKSAESGESEKSAGSKCDSCCGCN